MTIPELERWGAACGAVVLFALAGTSPVRAATNAPDARLAALQQLIERVQRDPGQANPETMQQLLALSGELGRPQAAAAVIKNYLSQHREPAPALLLQAARTAEQAGDLHSAVARYKQVLKLAPAAPDTVLRLFRLLVDDLDAGDEAFRLMTELGDAARATPALQRYDGWYLDQARRRKDMPALAGRLAAMLADPMPLELERFACWDSLDALMHDLAAARPDQFAALPACRRIAGGLIRGNEAWSRRFAFLTANLGFAAGAAGKDAAALERDFDAVAAAARAYVDAAPTAETVREIERTFAGGWDRCDEALLRQQGRSKTAWFVYAFGKLPDAQRDLTFAGAQSWDPNFWLDRLATREQYSQLVAAAPDYFRRLSCADRIPLMNNGTNPAVYKALAPAMQGVPNLDALAIDALGSGDDLYGCWQRVVQDSWFVVSCDEISRTLADRVWLRYRDFPRANGRLPDEHFDRVLARFGADVLSRTPQFLFDGNLARGYALAAWRYAAADSLDKSKVAAAFHALDWIPYTDRDREYVFGAASDDFRGWVGNVRNQQRDRKSAVDTLTRDLDGARQARSEEARKPNANLAAHDPRVADLTRKLTGEQAELARLDAAVRAISPLEDLFRQVRDPKNNDLGKAPDELCRNLARAVVAMRDKNAAAFQEAARAAYPAVREYAAKKQPFGHAAFLFLLKNYPDKFDTLDLQCEVVADLLGRGTPESGNAVLGEVLNLTNENRPWWNDGRQKDKRLKLNVVLAKGMRDLLAKDQYSDVVFGWFLGTRRAQDWRETERDQDIMEALVKRPELLGARPGRVVALMTWLRDDFPKLAEKYPLTSWFDEAFAAECRQRRYVDHGYYDNGGRDEKGVVAQAVAEVFQTYDRLPFGYDDGAVVYANREHFWDLQGRAMGATPSVRDAMLARIESCGGKTRFDHYANGGARLSTFSLGGPADRQRYFELLNAWLEAREREPVKAWMPSITPVSRAGSEFVLAPAELDALLRLVRLAPEWNWWEVADLDRLLHTAMLGARRHGELFALAPQLWGLARAAQVNTDNIRSRLVGTANALADGGQTDLAATYAMAGLEIMGNALKDDQRNALVAIKARALSGMLAIVSVDRADRRYPIFQAQADFQMGKYEEAWQLCLNQRGLFGEAFHELDPAFGIWLIARLTDVGNYADAEADARLMIQWVEQSPQSFDPEERANLLLAYANLSFARQEYPRARAICEQVATAKEFEDTRGRRDADLKIAEIDRLTKHYDQAIERLENMLRKRDAYVQAEANYQLALVRFDREEYPEARANLDKVLAVAPAHPNARILEGRLYLRMKKLVEATEVRVGLSASQQTIVPGKPLKISLEDRNLAVVGQAASIEIRAWTESGDEEVFSLLPFGDSKTKFEGQIPTALAPIRPGDKTLQVRGGDVVHYDFSEAFKRANKIAGEAPAAIRVLSDAQLFISSGRILSREEEEQRQLERLIRARLQTDAPAEPMAALSTVRVDDEVKPGNRINVRVINPGASVTTNRDRVSVSVSASSGDRIDQVELLETDPYSGVFEGFIQTASAPATALALDSEDGKDPNFAIAGAEYPPWVALPDNRRPKWFSVDLNNRVTLGAMKLVADVPGRRLRKFVVQVSPNGEDFVSLGAWPASLQGWLGAGQLDVVRFGDANRAPASVRECREFLEIGCTAAGCEKITLSPPPLEVRWDRDVNGLGERLQLGLDGPGSWYLGHIQGSFYQAARQKRTFRVAGSDPKRPPKNCFLTIDDKSGSQPYEASRSLAKGMHRLDVYFAATRQAGMRFWVEADVPGRAPFAKCTPELFATPTNVPAGEIAQAVRAVAFQPATIASTADNGVFDIAFPSNTFARVVRFWLLDYETDAPAIRKIHLTSNDGKRILPTAQDVVKLRENDWLEILPGDRITVSYRNPSYLTKERQFSEAFMRVTFHNATLNACFIESDVDADGTRRPRYIPMRRFKAGDTINVFISDADCDTSDARDVVPFRVRAGAAGAVTTIDALETEPHSGVFLGKVFPVAGAPQRPSEVQLGPNDDLTLTYLDVENTDPGIPWERSCVVEQATDATPELGVYRYASRLLSEAELGELRRGQDGTKKPDEVVPVSRTISLTLPDGETHGLPNVLLGCPLVVQVTHPAQALSPQSRVALYVQTESGRQQVGRPLQGAFDLQVPGTLRLEATPGERAGIAPPPGYREVAGGGASDEATALDDGRFTFTVPVKLGPVPSRSLVDAGTAAHGTDGRDRGAVADTDDAALSVRGNDRIYVGYPYRDEQGSNRWLTAAAAIVGDTFFDVMDRRYQEAVTNLHVGESLFLRVIDPALDRSDEKGVTAVRIATSSGRTQVVEIAETFNHSGVFMGVAQSVYAGDTSVSNLPGVMRVDYGDALMLTVASPATSQKVARAVQVFRGADGFVTPFTKRFKDPAIAVQTQFTLAESYFEMAKKHRELKQEELARREIGQGKKLLEEAIRDYPDTDARAQADYLLANLAIEYATQVPDDAQKTRYYLEAIGRFTDIVASYPDNAYAPKAQFRKALTYEKMGRIDEACEEYVKLSYRYPDNELVAETIARLGQYFLTKGKEFEEQSNAQADAVQKEKTRLQAVEMFKTAAQVFGRLGKRFPDHQLAAKTAVLSGQSWMRAHDLDQAIATFNQVIAAKKGAPELLAEAMYWCGDAHLSKKDNVNAYRMLKKLTWDYPETTWAKYARGRLSEPEMSKVEEQETAKGGE